jgi:hypothetical protein
VLLPLASESPAVLSALLSLLSPEEAFGSSAAAAELLRPPDDATFSFPFLKSFES